MLKKVNIPECKIESAFELGTGSNWEYGSKF
jgi:hypothetical protein